MGTPCSRPETTPHPAGPSAEEDRARAGGGSELRDAEKSDPPPPPENLTRLAPVVANQSSAAPRVHLSIDNVPRLALSHIHIHGVRGTEYVLRTRCHSIRVPTLHCACDGGGGDGGTDAHKHARRALPLPFHRSNISFFFTMGMIQRPVLPLCIPRLTQSASSAPRRSDRVHAAQGAGGQSDERRARANQRLDAGNKKRKKKRKTSKVACDYVECVQRAHVLVGACLSWFNLWPPGAYAGTRAAEGVLLAFRFAWLRLGNPGSHPARRRFCLVVHPPCYREEGWAIRIVHAWLGRGGENILPPPPPPPPCGILSGGRRAT
jgi:hypothetical protein